MELISQLSMFQSQNNELRTGRAFQSLTREFFEGRMQKNDKKEEGIPHGR
jgi:hypothetical protein